MPTSLSSKSIPSDSAFPRVSGKILIVDDSSVFARVLERFLARHELSCCAAESAEAALEIMRADTWRPDLVLTDVHMTGMSGIDLLRAIRSERRHAETPVVLLTSDEDVETELRALSEGADGYFGKSDDPRLLCAKLANLIERSRAPLPIERTGRG